MPQNLKTDFHLTISPKFEWLTPDSLKNIYTSLDQYCKSSVSAFETGSSGSHDHLHMLMFLENPKRKRDLEKITKTLCRKHMNIDEDISNPEHVILRIKYANKPLYLVQQYLVKELDPIYKNYDIQPILDKEEYYRVRSLGSEIIPINKKNFLSVYSDFITIHKIKPITNNPDHLKTHYIKVRQLMYKKNYDITLMVDQKKSCLEKLMIFYNFQKLQRDVITVTLDNLTGCI